MHYKRAIAGLMVAGALMCLEGPAIAKATAHRSAAKTANQETVHINIASAQQLSSGLEDVGAVKAKAIVAYRKKHGPFKKLADLTRVHGIGPKTLAENRKHLQLN